MTSIDAVIQRAKAASIETDVRRIEYEDDVNIVNYVLMPSGTDTRRIPIHSEERADRILSIEFERYTFLGDYEAIVDLQNGEIEAMLSSRDPLGASRIERLLGFSRAYANEDETGGEENEELALQAEGPGGVRLEISKFTENVQVLSSRPALRDGLSLKIFLGRDLDYDTAVSALEVISDSLFFQIDMDRGVTLSLRKSLRRRRPAIRRKHDASEATALQFPAFEYDSAPISLYWYAKSARGMPLLQFLAYYQVAEYYFPNFAKLEAIRSARKILKHPTFRVDRESDLTRLVSSISGNGRVGSSEREQIKATVGEVLTLDDVNQYFSAKEDVGEIVGKKQKGITDKTINLKRKDHDHRPEIAELLYDIRCRIVHTKNEIDSTRSEILLPFSTAEEKLWAYIDLMQFVAQQALIRSSSVLRTF